MSKKCSCSEFQDLKLPCQHAIATISRAYYLIGICVSEIYLKETYKNTYMALFHPINTRNLEKYKDCRPCSLRRRNKCSVCGGEGHTKRSYKCPGSGTTISILLGRDIEIKTWRHLPLPYGMRLQDGKTLHLKDVHGERAMKQIYRQRRQRLIRDMNITLPILITSCDNVAVFQLSKRISSVKTWRCSQTD